MAPKKSLTKSKSTRNGTASIKLKKPLRRRPVRCKAMIQRLVRKEVTKQVSKVRKQLLKIQHAVNSLIGLGPTLGSLPNQTEPSAQRRLRLHFLHRMPNKLFTANIVHPIADATEDNVPVSVALLDENNNVVKEGPLSSLRVEIFVACGNNSKVEESETLPVDAREEKGSLLVGNCPKNMENGVCSFNDLKFVDNSSWVRGKMFRLVAKVAEIEPLPSTVDIRQGVSGAFRVKDQRGKSNDKHPIPSWNDEVRRLEKIGIKNNGKLEAAGIYVVKDFLQKYNIDQSSLRKVLGVKDGVWETIVQHATKCTPNNDYFRYDSTEGVELLFDCFYKLIGASFDHQNDCPLENLTEHQKCHVEKVRRLALMDESKLIQINFPADWPSDNTNSWITPQSLNPQNHVTNQGQKNEVVWNNCQSFPQTPLLLNPADQIMQLDGEEEEEASEFSIGGMKDIYALLRSDTLLWDSLIVDNENHPLSIPDFNIAAKYPFDGQGSSCTTVRSNASHRWYRLRPVVYMLSIGKISTS